MNKWVVRDGKGNEVATGGSESGAWNKICWDTHRTVSQLQYLGYTCVQIEEEVGNE
jgi:hypothetical protein